MTLEGKKLLITGVINRESIAFEVAKQAQAAGAEIVLTGFGRAKRMTERSAGRLDPVPDVLELDVNKPEDIEAVAEDLRERWGRVDGILHAIAFAPEDALGGNFLNTPVESAITAFTTSAFSLKALTVGLSDLFPEEGAAIVGLDFDAQVAWPVYDWMGVAKAALEATARYLARDLGPRRVRVNLVSAGPLATLAARGIPGFGDLATAWEKQAPLPWDVEDPAPVAETINFLLSDASRAITAEIIHVDGGFHAMGTQIVPLREEVEACKQPRLSDRRDGLPRHGGPRAPARARRPRRLRPRARGGFRRRAGAPAGRDGEAVARSVAVLLARPCGRGRRHAARAWASTRPSARASPRRSRAVMHCAASISFDLPLDEARLINVEGTREIIGLAREAKSCGRLDRFIHVSTAYVAGITKGTFREHQLDAGPGVPQHLRADQVGGRARRQRRVRPQPGDRPPVDRDGRVRPPAGRPRSTSCTSRSASSRAGCSRRSRRGPRRWSTSSRSTTSPTRWCTCSRTRRPRAS